MRNPKYNQIIAPDKFYTKDVVDPILRGCIGDYTYGKPEISGLNPDFLRIGKFCSIAGGVKILLGAGHDYRNVSSYPFDGIRHNGSLVWKTAKSSNRKGKTSVFIGNDVWIGCRVTILPGVRIGDGAVIGAGSIVSKDIPPYCIAFGNPISFTYPFPQDQEYRTRFTGEQIEQLLNLKWWDWPTKKILEALPYMNDIEIFLQKYG